MFNDILFYHELTTCRDKTAFMNKWKVNEYQVDYNIAKYLIVNDIVELDSGNWETGEEHYRLATGEFGTIPISILERIKFLKEKLYFSHIDNYIKNSILKEILEIELQYSRKIKIRKLNEYKQKNASVIWVKRTKKKKITKNI